MAIHRYNIATFSSFRSRLQCCNAYCTYCDTHSYVLGGWLVGWVVTRVICGQTVIDTVYRVELNRGHNTCIGTCLWAFDDWHHKI